MKFPARLAIVLTIARFVEPQLFPSCAQPCATDIDYTSGSAICDSIRCCLYEQCRGSDLKAAEQVLSSYCRYISSGTECSAASSSADMQPTEEPKPEQISATVDGRTAEAESATANSSGSETVVNSASEPSSLPTSSKNSGSATSNSGTAGNDHALTLKLGLGLGIGLGVPLVAAIAYLAFLQGRKHNGQGTPNNQQPQQSSYQVPPSHGYPPPAYPPSSHLSQGYPTPSPPPQVQSQQGQFDSHKPEHESSAVGAVRNVNQHEVMGNIPPLRHELSCHTPRPRAEIPPGTQPDNELP
ncbi:hypothetical protein ACJZ2D_009798 [Fusarium nematophilum]